MTKRFKLIFIPEDNEWSLYDSIEEKYYDIDVSDYEKEVKRIKRNHINLHEKYEEIELKYKECKRKNSRLEGNESSAKRIYLNLKECFDE